MASRDNAYLARAAVNRVWWLMFGRGLVDPVDDMGPHNPPSHPEVLNRLADFFVESGYDLRELIRAVARTQAYQLGNSDQALATEQFAAMATKVMSAEQLFDSLVQACQRPAALRGGSLSNPLLNPRRTEFVAKMASQTRDPLEYEGGLQQTLHMMNSPLVGSVVSDATQGILAAIEAPYLSAADRIEILFLATLGRRPTEAEQALVAAHAEREAGRSAASLAPALWALVNSAEFCLVR